MNKSSKGHWNYSIPSDPSDSMIAKIRYSKLRHNLENCVDGKLLFQHFINIQKLSDFIKSTCHLSTYRNLRIYIVNCCGFL